MSDVLIEVDNLSKRFCRSLKRSLWYAMHDLSSEIGGRRNGSRSGLPQNSRDVHLRGDEFWAVKDVSFELRRGECLGLIGSNGAGKTTLLRLLNGLIKPDTGHISMKGTMGALIALGAGFNPVLTGRENIYVNGSIMGLSKKQIDLQLDEVIDFSGIGKFVDSPVQSYSSGMSVRLGFATAAVMIKPDILLLDEVLAVGDLEFRYKCFARISKLIEGSAVILVSHDMPSIARIASQVLLLSEGRIEHSSTDVASAIQAYSMNVIGGSSFKQETGEATIEDISVSSTGKTAHCSQVDYGDDVDIKFTIAWREFDPEANLVVNILDKGDNAVAQMESNNHGFTLNQWDMRSQVNVRIPRFPLAPGDYRLWIILSSPSKKRSIAVHYGVSPFKVRGSFIGYVPFQPIPDWSLTRS